uniref:Uncharacterized protein n=1 Tax=Trypanosoma vivax (strain Y486) TaxID=1055687 RepID=G0UAJ3_TRYVY|nr:conserved hypothetical protein [Trypanosoma vivax Y486]
MPAQSPPLFLSFLNPHLRVRESNTPFGQPHHPNAFIVGCFFVVCPLTTRPTFFSHRFWLPPVAAVEFSRLDVSPHLSEFLARSVAWVMAQSLLRIFHHLLSDTSLTSWL